MADGVVSGLSKAASKLGIGNSKTKILTEIANITGKVLKIGNYAKQFGKLCDIFN